MRKFILFAALGSVASCWGCGLRRPFERPPGTVDRQRAEAAQFDPYADNDLGPEVVGSRPRDFQKPEAQPVRSRANPASQLNDHRGWFRGWFGFGG